MSKPMIYFLCTGNSCRSQIAEGFGHHYLNDQYEVHSKLSHLFIIAMAATNLMGK